MNGKNRNFMSMINLLSHCALCPRECNVDRLSGKPGFCGAVGNNVRIARAGLHKWEEPCISGTNGSGTVFFSHCSLKCVYCQNMIVSRGEVGTEVSVSRLAEIFLSLQNENAHNINLVTPTHYIPQIIDAVALSRKQGLIIPIVYNTSGYELVSSIKLLAGTVDIYLTDFKYMSEEYSHKYSGANNYSQFAKSALDEMVKQIGIAKFDENDIMQRGVIVRHLALPGLSVDSRTIIRYLYNKYGNDIILSLMNQYTPNKHVINYPELSLPLEPGEYERLVNFTGKIGVTLGFIQEGGTVSESFVPDFDFK